MNKFTEDQFLKYVAEHQMTVIHEDGVHRHIRFSRPGTSCMHFDLITWPGSLCYTGDMGTYVFSRLHDMFEFFRTDREYSEKKGQKLSINLGYWAEKVQAPDKYDGLKKYDADKFRQTIGEWLDSGEVSDAVREAVNDDVLSCADDGPDRAMDAAMNFEHDGFTFRDFWECDLTEYSHRFVWCCYALAWGILQYDASSAEPSHPASKPSEVTAVTEPNAVQIREQTK